MIPQHMLVLSPQKDEKERKENVREVRRKGGGKKGKGHSLVSRARAPAVACKYDLFIALLL